MRIIFKLTAVLLILSGCTNIDQPVEKSRLEANDYRLFQGTEVWLLVKAAKKRDFKRVNRILFLIVLTVIFTLSSAFENQKSDLCETNPRNMIYESLPDSVYALLRNKPIIFYSYGHYGYSWSMIARIDTNYRIYNGRVGYKGERFVYDQSQSTSFDTTRLISNNHHLISWGLDTLATEAINMRTIKPETYISFYTDLSIFDSNGVNVFSSNDAVAYSGNDSLTFNNKFHKLCLIMRWISEPRLREFIPDSAILQTPKSGL